MELFAQLNEQILEIERAGRAWSKLAGVVVRKQRCKSRSGCGGQRDVRVARARGANVMVKEMAGWQEQVGQVWWSEGGLGQGRARRKGQVSQLAL